MNKTRLIIIDDHELIRVMIYSIIEETLDNCVIYQANDAAEAILIMKQDASIDFVFLDIKLPDMNGVELLPTIKELLPHANIIVISGEYGVGLSRESILAFISKNASVMNIRKEIKNIFSQIMGKKDYLPSNITFSKRQMQIMDLVVKGYTNNEIAKESFLTEGSVKNIITSVYKKLCVKGRYKAITLYKNIRFDLKDRD